ncbi:L,D-transpeptidase [uncultured Jatrophihabitans sp.]|uniref:L,D-transpeptidase n=1 Tax=uncultured Jatrophihabitans sp. TaxID=1610747 RepID=UPI0035CAC926
MRDDELGRLLSDAFDAQARGAFGEHTQAPPPRFADELAAPAHRRWVRVGAPLVAAAAVLALVLTVAFISSGSDDGHRRLAGPSAAPSALASAPAASSSAAALAGPGRDTAVHVKLLNSDGSDYGVGMPVIAFFSKKIKNAKPLQDATTVTVDGKPATGAWYFEYSSANKGYPIEGHFRLENYWPANSRIHVAIPVEGLSAGTGLSYDNSLALDFRTHDRIVSTVDDSTHRMTVTDNGKKYGTFPVSLGASSTPTTRGTKVIMEKGRSICMSGPGYSECGIKWTQRLTYGGEYLHSAPWNIANIDDGRDSSNGCTNLLPTDAQKLYGFLGIGDVVIYPNANGPAMTLGAGYGDWNVNWSTWRTGGLVPTS